MRPSPLATTQSVATELGPSPSRTSDPAPKERRRPFRLTRARVAILVIVLVAAGLGGWKWTHRGPQPVEVQTAVVQRADLQAKVTANGRIQAQRKVDISATIAGQITHLAVKEGDRVSKGQFLLEIDPVSP